MKNEKPDLYLYDKEQNIKLLCGVDEAGRGPLAGDVYAAAVILDPDCKIEGINDSKKLSAKKRELLYDEIKEKAISYCVATASIDEIEEYNILNAAFLAMSRAVNGLSVKPQLALVDGNKNPKLSVHSRCVVKGDSLSASIASASILAKVERDRYMEEIAKQYPQYMFEKHKGYGTKLHYEMLDKYGASDVHRKSFLKKYFEQKQNTARDKGDIGEKLAVKFLQKHDFTVLSRNYSSIYGEIDIIAKKDDTIAFVEVKTRKPESLLLPREAVDAKKQQKIIKTALSYMEENNLNLQPSFDVLEIYMPASKEEKAKVNYIKNAFEGRLTYESF